MISRRNFALGASTPWMPTPKSLPAFFPDVDSSRGSTTSSVVPGRTVLFTATQWYVGLSLSTAPIWRATSLASVHTACWLC